METIKQVSVFLENKPGRLANVLSALAREKVNITALSVMDSHEHSVLRLVTSDAARTSAVLKGLGTPHHETDVLLVELRNQPGALAHVCETLGAEKINIDYAYPLMIGPQGRAALALHVDDHETASTTLINQGFTLITENDLDE